MWGMTSLDTLHVDVLHGVPLLFCHFEEGMPRIDSGVVDQHIDAAKALERIVHHGRHGVATARVGLKGKGRSALRF
jgi:hypothetical protein